MFSLKAGHYLAVVTTLCRLNQQNSKESPKVIPARTAVTLLLRFKLASLFVSSQDLNLYLSKQCSQHYSNKPTCRSSPHWSLTVLKPVKPDVFTSYDEVQEIFNLSIGDVCVLKSNKMYMVSKQAVCNAIVFCLNIELNHSHFASTHLDSFWVNWIDIGCMCKQPQKVPTDPRPTLLLRRSISWPPSTRPHCAIWCSSSSRLRRCAVSTSTRLLDTNIHSICTV